MRSAYVIPLLGQLCVVALCSSLSAYTRPLGPYVQSFLRSRLSRNASITYGNFGAPRWSDFEGPHPGIVVSVAVEKDVQETVQDHVVSQD